MKIKVSLDREGFSEKPVKQVGIISSRIAEESEECEIEELAESVGRKGHTFCPAVFTSGRRKAENFDEMQVFALDFDSGSRYEEMVRLSEEYRLPIAFAYHTFSSTQEFPRFRLVFVNDVRVTDQRAAKIMMLMLLGIFEEADSSCKDVSRMFFGGNRLIGPVRNETIDIIQVAESFQRKMFEADGKHYAKRIRKFAQRNQIACINDFLGIERVHQDGTSGGNSGIDQYLYRSETVFPPDIPKYVIYDSYQRDVRENRMEKEQRKMIRIQTSDLQKCRLYTDFLMKEHIHHKERFLLLTNLLFIEGGKKLFFTEIKRKNYDEKKWRFYAKYMKDKGYKPQSCEGNCIYCKACQHKENMVLTVHAYDKIIRTEQEVDYESAEDVYDHIRNCLIEAVKGERAGIYVIPAQTAIGKTESYCQLIQRDLDRRYMIAVPTNRLKQEVKKRLERMGVSAEATISLEEVPLPKTLVNRIKLLYGLGLGRKVAKELRYYVKEHENSCDPEIIGAVEVCRQYLSGEERIQEARVVVTTHARLITLSEEMIQEFTVIIDEDILSTFFKNMKEVWLEDLIKIKDSGRCPRLLGERLEEILAAPEKSYQKFLYAIGTESLSEELLEELEVFHNVNEISYAGSYYKEEGHIRYFCPCVLQRGKYIVLSATADAALYKSYFSGWYVKEYPYRKARYIGRLKQLTAYSMSRQCIQEHMKQIKDVQKLLGGEKQNVITFLKYENVLSEIDLHYGNTEGVDSLKGENMILIGTPHQNEFVYKLIGIYLDMPVNQDILAVRKVRYGGYEFSIMTYKNECLRDLQFYFIKKELEQSIGRARLLRCDCTVVLFSNFPCEQAELIQDDYFENPEILAALQPVMAGKS